MGRERHNKVTGCRIGRVFSKATGKQIPRIVPTNVQKHELMTATKTIVEWMPEEKMSGYFVMAWEKDGHYYTGWHIDLDGVVGNAMAPSFVADAFRRDLIKKGW